MTSPESRTAVLLMAYGTPRHPDEIEEYYTDIRRGRPPTPELLAELVARYEAIGGISPLARLTEDQRDGLQAALDVTHPGRFEVVLGLKHAAPMIEAAVDDLAARGFGRIIGLVLAPHYSSYWIGQYMGRARTAAEPHGITVEGVESWATEGAYIDFLVADLGARLAAMPAGSHVFFTAHSLPTRIIDAGDPYPTELRATAEAVAARLGLEEGRNFAIAWQSAGRTPEPWLGPDILEVIDRVAPERSAPGVIVSAVGFGADQLEVLYDLDIEASAAARDRGLAFDRTASVNAHPGVLTALARRVAELDRD